MNIKKNTGCNSQILLLSFVNKILSIPTWTTVLYENRYTWLKCYSVKDSQLTDINKNRYETMKDKENRSDWNKTRKQDTRLKGDRETRRYIQDQKSEDTENYNKGKKYITNDWKDRQHQAKAESHISPSDKICPGPQWSGKHRDEPPPG